MHGDIEVAHLLQAADRRGYHPCRLVAVEIEVGQLLEVAYRLRDVTGELVAVQVESREDSEAGVGDGACELAAAEVDVIQLGSDVTKLRWDGASKPVPTFPITMHRKNIAHIDLKFV